MNGNTALPPIRRRSSRGGWTAGLIAVVLTGSSLAGTAGEATAAAPMPRAPLAQVAPLAVPLAITGSTPKVSDTTPTVRQVLHANPGTWSPAGVVLTYHWYRVSGTGALTAVGATGADYPVAPADAGQKLKVTVTGTAAGLGDVSRTSALTSKVTKATIAAAPTPVLDDTTPTVDTEVAAIDDVGSWLPADAGITLAYQWYRISSSGKTYRISGATHRQFRPRPSDVGYRLKVKVTGSAQGFSSKSRYSSRTAKVVKATFALVPDPTIGVAGTPRVGKPLTALPGDSSPDATSYGYQWYRGTSAIKNATKVTYVPNGADLGKALRVKVTSRRSGYVSVTRYSAVTTPIAAGIVMDTPSMNDSTPKVGQLLIVDAVALAGELQAELTYHWFSGSTLIPDATVEFYQVRRSDRGKSIKVVVVASAPDYAPVSKSKTTSTVTS